MRNSLFIIIFILSSLSIKAQDSVIQLPDSAGKYLFEAFINKADLSKSEILFAKTDYFNPKDMWPALLDKVSEFKLDPQNTEYCNTFFKQTRYQERFFSYELYVSMKHEGKIYAFRADVSWKADHWQLEKVDTDLFLYSEMGETEAGFRNITNDELMFVDPNPKFNKDFKSTVNTLHPQTLPAPESFSKKVLKLLSEEAPFGNDEIFLTKQEYMYTEGARIIKMIDKFLENGVDLDDEKEKIMLIYNNPEILYDEQARHWNMLPESLKEEFGDNIKELDIQDIESNISNWNTEKGIIDTPVISATISMPLYYDGKNAGIYFSAIWYNGMWKLSHIQGFAYGISSAESSEAEDVEDEIAAIPPLP